MDIHKPARAADTAQPSIEVQGLRQLTVEDGSGLATRVSGRKGTSEASAGRQVAAEATAQSDSGLSCPFVPHVTHVAAIILWERVPAGGNVGRVSKSHSSHQYQMLPLCQHPRSSVRNQPAAPHRTGRCNPMPVRSDWYRLLGGEFFGGYGWPETLALQGAVFLYGH